ncbi:MAG: DUF362 domain-containing protein [Kiritimatiellae bacterium]|nr:DUF362 domain-containing protein [Kiritimatiellia bacterium]
MVQRVDFVSCTDYAERLPVAVDELFSVSPCLAGARFAGRRVLVKPNMLTDRLPEQAVTTHPELLRQVVRKLKRFGAKVTVGDSPQNVLKLQQVWDRTGISAVCSNEQVPLVSFEQSARAVFELAGSDGAAHTVVMAGEALDAELVVNLPKVKSHFITRLSAAVKNVYGTVPGPAKTELHKFFSKNRDFARLLQEIWRRLPPSVSIADGVVGMSGEGPSNGYPLPMGFLAAAESPFALDYALCRVLAVDPARVPYLSGCGVAADEVELMGEVPKVGGFEVPSGLCSIDRLPNWLVRWTGNMVWVRPAFDYGRCIGCGRCVSACPKQALSLAGGKARRPVLKKRDCISCACCHEACPRGAVEMKPSALTRMLRIFHVNQ